MDHSRRSFLKTSVAVTAGLAAACGYAHVVGSGSDTTQRAEPVNDEISAPGDIPLLEGPAHGEIRKGDMIYRPLGATGEMVSLIGMGGFHLGKTSSEDEAIRLIHAAVDNGITFMDNCWDYNRGTSELRAGKAYKEGGYRDKVFQMTKIDGRTKKAAARQIDESLARLQTDHIDKQEVLDQALAAVKTYHPMDKATVTALLGRTRAAAQMGQSELYKTTWHFDGTAQNPDWLGLKE